MGRFVEGEDRGQASFSASMGLLQNSAFMIPFSWIAAGEIR